MTQKTLRQLLKADLKSVKSRSCLSVDTKNRSEEWKGANTTEIWRFNLRWSKQKVSPVPLSECWCQCAEERSGGCLHPAPHQQSFLCTHVARSSLLPGDSNQTVTHVLFIAIKWRAKTTQLLTRIPLCEKPTELQTPRVPNVHLRFQNPVFHTHFSIGIVHRVFSTSDTNPVVKINSHNKEIELSSRAPKFRSLIIPNKSQSTELPFSHRWLSIADASTTCNSWNEYLGAISSLMSTGKHSSCQPPSSESIFFPVPWTKSFYLHDSL